MYVCVCAIIERAFDKAQKKKNENKSTFVLKMKTTQLISQ